MTPTLLVWPNGRDRALPFANDADILAQPCVAAALTRAEASGYRAGVETERAAVVAWLRRLRDETYEPPVPVQEYQLAADLIERGNHLHTPPKE